MIEHDNNTDQRYWQAGSPNVGACGNVLPWRVERDAREEDESICFHGSARSPQCTTSEPIATAQNQAGSCEQASGTFSCTRSSRIRLLPERLHTLLLMPQTPWVVCVSTRGQEAAV